MKIASILATFVALTFITASLASSLPLPDPVNNINEHQISTQSTHLSDSSDAITHVLDLDQVSHAQIEDIDSNDLNELNTAERTSKGKYCKYVWVTKCGYKCTYGKYDKYNKYNKKYCKYVCVKKKVYKCYYPHRTIDDASVDSSIDGSANEEMNETNELDTTERTSKGKYCKYVWVKKCGYENCTYGKYSNYNKYNNKYCKYVCDKKKVYKCY